MSDRASTSTRTLAVCLTATLTAAVLTNVSPAGAGIGNPLKKAKEKVEKTVSPEQPAATKPAEPLVFDDLMLELTEARVAKITAAYKDAGAITAGRPALVERRAKASDEHAKIDEKHGEKVRETQRIRGDIESCYHDGYQAAQERKIQEYSQRALTDPVLRDKFAKAAAENNEAAARGDSAAIARINAVLYAEILPSKEDSVKAREACGPLPPRSASEKRMDELYAEMNSLDKQIRAMDDAAAKALSKKGGLTEQQWGMATERITMFLQQSMNDKGPSGDSKGSDSGSGSEGGSGSGSGSGSGAQAASTRYAGFTDEELDALFKHRQELRGYLGY